MKSSFKIFFLVMAVFVTLYCHGNVPVNLKIEGTTNKRLNEIPEGAQITLLGFLKTPEGDVALVNYENRGVRVSLNQLSRITFNPRSVDEFWVIRAIEGGVYNSILRNGYQYDLRMEIDNDVRDYLGYLSQNDLLFHDSFVLDYIRSLVYRILPRRIDDARPGFVNVYIVKDPLPNAGVYSNGTLVINTGLFSTIESEEELLAVLAHEISHYVLDHSVLNLNAALRRQKRAEFWASLATGIVAVTESYVASKDPNYYPGELTWWTSLLSQTVSDAINERLGVKYSREQELEADRCAIELLKFIGGDPTALSSVLLKINSHYTVTNNFQALAGTGSHPANVERIGLAGTPGEFQSLNYDRKISFVNTFSAQQLVLHHHFDPAEKLAWRNINAGVATEDDYLVLVDVNLLKYYDPDKNAQALEYLKIAKSLNIYPGIQLLKKEAIVYMRLRRLFDAGNSLVEYKEAIESFRSYNTSSYLEQEYEWTMKMLAKVKLL